MSHKPYTGDPAFKAEIEAIRDSRPKPQLSEAERRKLAQGAIKGRHGDVRAPRNEER